MITKFEIFENKIDDLLLEYPFTEEVSLVDIGQKCCNPDDDYVDCQQFEEILKRKVLNKLCTFYKDEEYVNPRGNIEKKKGMKITGVILSVDVTTFFDFDVTISFMVSGHIDTYEVYPLEPVIVHLKEERKKIVVDKTLDPYGEEEWDD